MLIRIAVVAALLLAGNQQVVREIAIAHQEIEGYVIEQVLPIGGAPVMRIRRRDAQAPPAAAPARPLLEISAADLPVRNEDCGGYCRSMPAVASCYGLCIRSGPSFLAFDSPRRQLYVSATTDHQGNVPFVIFAVDLATAAPVRRIGMVTASTLLDAKLSPDGRYLSFLAETRLTGAEGTWRVEIFDVQSGAQIQASGGDALAAGSGDVAERGVTSGRGPAVASVLHHHWLNDHRVAMVVEMREPAGADRTPDVDRTPGADRTPAGGRSRSVHRVFDVATGRISEKPTAR